MNRLVSLKNSILSIVGVLALASAVAQEFPLLDDAELERWPREDAETEQPLFGADGPESEPLSAAELSGVAEGEVSEAGEFSESSEAGEWSEAGDWYEADKGRES